MIRIGVVGTSAIAERRMIPAIRKEPAFRYEGAAFSTREEMGFRGAGADFAPVLEKKRERARRFQESFGGRIWESYAEMLSDPDVDAVYIALPPALHFRWARLALEQGKHVLLEKPFTTRLEDAETLIRLAGEKGLAMAENYGFPLHAQMELIRGWMAEGAIGQLRLVRATFGFPHRDSSDFRYDPALGGGALLDCGGYTLKAATAVLGPAAEVLAAAASSLPGHRVDMTGSVLMRSPEGVCAQLAYGMDHDYRCELEIWGSEGTITASRIFTAPDGFPAPVRLKNRQGEQEKAAADDQFLKVLRQFAAGVENPARRAAAAEEILVQSRLTDAVRRAAGIAVS